MIALVMSVVGVVVFGAAGWLGVVVADVWYLGAVPLLGGSRSPSIPRAAFVGVPACVGGLAGVHAIPPLTLVMLLIAVVALTVCAFCDLRAGFIPDAFSVGPLLAVLALATFRHEWAPLWGALFAALPFAGLSLISRGRGMGWGDAKLAALGGALIGVGGIAVAVTAASLTAWIVSAVQHRLRRPIVFGPYLAGAIGLSLAFGNAF